MNSLNNSSNKILDERIQATADKLAAHAFYIIGIYISVSSFIKVFFLDINPVFYIDSFIVLLVASIYYTIRGVRSGLFLPDESNKNKKRSIIITIITSVFFGMLMAFIFKESDFVKMIIIAISSSIFYGIGYHYLIRCIDKTSLRRLNKLSGK